jgi:Flp pilus assembly protein CpaB
MTRPLVAMRRLRRTILARRRTWAAVCAALAVAAALQANAAHPPARTMVLTAARDLPGGVVMTAADLRRTAFEPDSVPAGTVGSAAGILGRTTAGPLRAGEPLTDVRLVTTSLLEGYPGLVAVPVRIGDAGAVRLLRVGDRIDVLAADPQRRSPAALVEDDVPVLAIPRPDDATPGMSNGALLVVGVSDSAARTLAQASVSSVLSIVLTR